MAEKAREWTTFVRQCLLQRISGNEFFKLAKLLIERNSLPGTRVLQILLRAREAFAVPYEPLVPKYIVNLYMLRHIGLPELLMALLNDSSLEDTKDVGTLKKAATYSTEFTRPKVDNRLASDFNIIQDVTAAFNNGIRPQAASDIPRSLSAISKWIAAILSRSAKEHMEGITENSLTASLFAGSLFEAIGILLIALLEDQQVMQYVCSPSNQEIKANLGQTLTAYIPFITQLSIPVGNKLDTFQKQYTLFDHRNSHNLGENLLPSVVSNGLHFEDSVLDGPIVNSRAGLYVYINAMLVGRPLVDDHVFMNYLHARYAGDHALIAIELITAAFDVVSHAMYHHESAQTCFVFRSFLVQKLPVFLSFVSASSLGTLPTEYCITQALSRIDPNAFPSFSQTFDPMRSGNIQLSDVRQEFLFACALHRLIREDSIVRLLGEDPMASLPEHLVKQDLMEQINASSERVEQLLDDLESMNGNAGVIVDAITEVLHNLCAHKETMTLKNMCTSLARKPQVFDVMLLFRSVSNILQPLCSLLDEWRWDDDIGEHQPVYDEFGSILLLILAFQYRYDLDALDFGIQNHGSFLARLFERRATSQRLAGLTESQNHHLGAWIKGLFSDEGINDELMSSCSPQEFYLLVPTLFAQSLGACDLGKLDIDGLKAGFEYLLEPFLLPSLVIALPWLSKTIWETGINLKTSIQALQALIKPSSISGEAQATHHTILSITGRRLEQSLREAKKHDASRKNDIDALLEKLKVHLSFQRTPSAHHKELENWTSTAGGGLLTSIRNVFQSLVLWSSTADISLTPPSYTHRQILAGIQLLGAVKVLRTLLDELKLQSETGSGDIALDVAVTLICAPTVAIVRALRTKQQQQQQQQQQQESNTPSPNMTSRLTLHEALLLEHMSLPQTSPPSDPLLASLIVRLHRRCCALLTAATAAPTVMIHEQARREDEQPEQVVEHMMQDISNLDEAAASLTANDAAAINFAATDANAAAEVDMTKIDVDLGDIDSMLEAANAAADGGLGGQQQQGSGGGDDHDMGLSGAGVGAGEAGLGSGLDDLNLMDMEGSDMLDLEDFLRG